MTDQEIFDKLEGFSFLATLKHSSGNAVARLDSCTVAGNIDGMIQTHIAILKSDNSETIKRPYRLRLISLIERYVEQG